ncbi:MAG: hypothetical protein H6970_02265 [Gammaproteobacteria bacterium]|nr:hypothetical protein [Gammaproteobacteria bacterium]MCP5423882.1 hypothetical protein [Gammaproteobacteria bacterium]
MKVNISVEATPQELRDFLGLPNVQPLQESIIHAIHDNMQKGVAGFDALSLMKPLLPMQTPLDIWQKAFWEAFSKANESAGPNTGTSDKQKK